MTVSILVGDCRAMLATLPEKSVQCCVTSPPYFGLRDYGTATWDGGDPSCDHRKVQDAKAATATSTLGGGKKSTGHLQEGFSGQCRRCGARRIDSQIGQEPTPDEFVAALVDVFRGVRRVLRDDGTVWLNLGDSYGPGKQLLGIPWKVAFALQADEWVLRSECIWAKKNPMPESVQDRPTKSHEKIFLFSKNTNYYYDSHAVAETVYPLLRDASDRGVLREKKDWEAGADVQVMHKSARAGVAEEPRGKGEALSRTGKIPSDRSGDSNAQAVRDISAAKSLHEGLFADRERESIEPKVEQFTVREGTAEEVFCHREGKGGNKSSSCSETIPNRRHDQHAHGGGVECHQGSIPGEVRLLRPRRRSFDSGSCDSDKQRRSSYEGERCSGLQAVQQPKEGSHTRRNLRDVWFLASQPFPGAHFATMPPELATTCIKAGTSERGQCPHCGAPWVRQTSRGAEQPVVAPSEIDRYGTGDAGVHRKVGGQYQKWLDANPMKTTGWLPSCSCPEHQPVPQMVLDPFGGAGTTALAADRLQRDATIIELNPAYAAIARERINGESSLFSPVAAE